MLDRLELIEYQTCKIPFSITSTTNFNIYQIDGSFIIQQILKEVIVNEKLGILRKLTA